MITDNVLRRSGYTVLNVRIIIIQCISKKVVVTQFQVLSQQQPFFYRGFLTNAEIVGPPWLGHNHFLSNTLGCIIHKSAYHLVLYTLGYCSVMSYIKK